MLRFDGDVTRSSYNERTVDNLLRRAHGEPRMREGFADALPGAGRLPDERPELVEPAFPSPARAEDELGLGGV